MAAAVELVREKAKTDKEEPEPAVTASKSLSDLFFDHCFNVALLMICAQYVATVYVFLKYSNSKWMTLCLIAFMATPMVGLMLYVMLKSKRECTENHAMAQLGAQVAVPGKATTAENV